MPDVKLKQWNGEEKVFSGAETITVPTESGGAEIFTHGELAEDITVDADFSNGNMVLSPGDGKMVKNVTVNKPENLIPENIAEGVDIAGVIGALAGGGAKIAMGSFIGNGSNMTVEHGLGMIPDIVYVTAKASAIGTKTINFLIGFSAAFVDLVGTKAAAMSFPIRGLSYDGGTWMSNSVQTSIENAASLIYGADTNQVSLGNGSGNYVLKDGTTYIWLAIGGLT